LFLEVLCIYCYWTVGVVCPSCGKCMRSAFSFNSYYIYAALRCGL